MFIPWVVYIWNLIFLLDFVMLGYLCRFFLGESASEGTQLTVMIVHRASLSLKCIKTLIFSIWGRGWLVVLLLSCAMHLFLVALFMVFPAIFTPGFFLCAPLILVTPPCFPFACLTIYVGRFLAYWRQLLCV